jgi:hypothetical protein
VAARAVLLTAALTFREADSDEDDPEEGGRPPASGSSPHNWATGESLVLWRGALAKVTHPLGRE